MRHLLRRCLWSVCLLSTPAAFAGHAIPTSAREAAALRQRLESAHWIAEGAARPAHVLYVFLDPSCPYCHALWQQITAAKRNDLQVRYLLVAVLSEDSRDKDAAILEAPHPAAALARHEVAFERGGIRAHPAQRATTAESITANETLMGDLHIRGTPGEAWIKPGAGLQVFTGMPDASQLEEMLGGAR